MATSQLVLAIELGVISSISITNKVGLCPLIIEAATDYLFYLAIMQVNTGSKLGQGKLPLPELETVQVYHNRVNCRALVIIKSR
jgi:hypothetical protein